MNKKKRNPDALRKKRERKKRKKLEKAAAVAHAKVTEIATHNNIIYKERHARRTP